MTLDEALVEAYRTWSETGFANVPAFDPTKADGAQLQARFDQLDALSQRCVICKTQASWLNRMIVSASSDAT